MMTGMPDCLDLVGDLEALGAAPEDGLELLLLDELDGQLDVLGLLDREDDRERPVEDRGEGFVLGVVGGRLDGRIPPRPGP